VNRVGYICRCETEHDFIVKYFENQGVRWHISDVTDTLKHSHLIKKLPIIIYKGDFSRHFLQGELPTKYPDYFGSVDCTTTEHSNICIRWALLENILDTGLSSLDYFRENLVLIESKQFIRNFKIKKLNDNDTF